MATPKIDLYTATVPIIQSSLKNQRAVLQQGEQWCKDNGHDASKILEARMTPDMLPLTFQIQTCCNTAVKLVVRLTGAQVDPIEDNEKTFDQLYARLDRTLDILQAADPATFQGKDDVQISFQAGPRTLEFVGTTYVQQFALPNFFFHHVTAYNILRKEGVPLGKMLFLTGQAPAQS